LCGRSLWQGLKGGRGAHLRGNVVVEVVAGLEVEKPFALVTADERLVTVVAKALATTLDLLRRGESAKLADRR
jgi:hypothetical protein